MNHTTLVRMLHALANLKHLAHTRSRVELARIGIGEQVATTDQFHRQERDRRSMARIDPCREYVRDIRMIEQGERLTFELEAAQGVWVILRTTQYLERDFTLRLLLFGKGSMLPVPVGVRDCA